MGLRARKYTKRIDIYQTLSINDGFGGNTIQDSFLTSSWGKIESLSVSSTFNNNDNNFGTYDLSNSFKLTLRKRNDLTYSNSNMFFLYRGEKYIFQNFPTNISFKDSEVEIIITKENPQQTSNSLFNIYAAYLQRVISKGGNIDSPSCVQTSLKLLLQ